MVRVIDALDIANLRHMSAHADLGGGLIAADGGTGSGKTMVLSSLRSCWGQG